MNPNVKKAALGTLFAVALALPAAAGEMVGMMGSGHDATHTHMVAGEVKDERAVIALTPAERALILTEMRQFLAGTQAMVQALTTEDMAAVAKAARANGGQMMHEVPAGLRNKLPMEFRQLGFGVHRDFDQLALDAEALKEPKHALKQLNGILQKCVACHSVYRIEPLPR